MLSHSTVDALRTWSLEVEPALLRRLTPAQQAAALYGATLAAIKLRDNTQAQVHWQHLADSVRKDAAASRLARLLGVELMLAMEDGQRAIALLQADDAVGRTSARVELLYAAQAQLKRSSPAPGVAPDPTAFAALSTTTQRLQTWVAEHPRDALAWQLLSSAYAAQGRTLSSIRAQAEISVAQLNYPAALSRFKTAQEWARKEGAGTDHHEASIVDTRTRQVESLLREQALER